MPLFSPESYKFAPWSMSKALTAHRCPHQFRLEYIEKEKGKEPPKQSANRIGLAAHDALEKVLTGQNDLREALRRAALKEKLTMVEMDELFALAHNISEFLRKLEAFKIKHKVTDQMVEMRFGLTDKLEPASYWEKKDGKDVEKKPFFRGVWDLVMRANGKYLIVIDHKSGAVKDLHAYEEQLRMYSIAGLHVLPGIVGVQTALNYIQNEEGVTWDVMNSAEKIMGELVPWFVEFVDKAAREAVSDIPRKGWWCSFCEFAQTCPLK